MANTFVTGQIRFLAQDANTAALVVRALLEEKFATAMTVEAKTSTEVAIYVHDTDLGTLVRIKDEINKHLK